MGDVLQFPSLIITPEMVAAGELESARAYDAHAIETLGGLGGCKTMDQTSPEVARYFGTEMCSAEVLFLAMDALCSTPYMAHPTPAMIEAGQEALSRLFSASMARHHVKRGEIKVEDCHESFRDLIHAKEPNLAIAYRAMRAAEQAF